MFFEAQSRWRWDLNRLAWRIYWVHRLCLWHCACLVTGPTSNYLSSFLYLWDLLTKYTHDRLYMQYFFYDLFFHCMIMFFYDNTDCIDCFDGPKPATKVSFHITSLWHLNKTSQFQQDGRWRPWVNMTSGLSAWAAISQRTNWTTDNFRNQTSVSSFVEDLE